MCVVCDEILQVFLLEDGMISRKLIEKQLKILTLKKGLPRSEPLDTVWIGWLSFIFYLKSFHFSPKINLRE